MKNLYRYRFGKVCYDEAQPSLTVDSQPVHLQARQRKLLSCLLTSPGKVIGRDELLDRVWGLNSDAKDHALTAAVDRLRRALGEDGICIRTVHGQGYQFTGKAERETVGTELETQLALAPGDAVPHRPRMRLRHMLGHSAACEVWAASDEATGDTRIFKIGSDALGLREIRRESRLLAHVQQVLGPRDDLACALATHVESAPYWIEMEDGGVALDRWTVETGFLTGSSVATRIDLILKVAHAVAALHGAALVHSDIKPGNILVRNACPEEGEPTIRLIDFGSGHVVTALLREHVKDLHESLMLPGGADPARGTYNYFAPELWKGGQPTVQSDIYALGVLLYQLLVGDFNARPDTGWERQISDALLVEDLSKAVDGDPERRFGSVQEFSRSLQQLASRRAAQRNSEEIAAQQARMELENQQLRLEKLRNDARRPLLRAAVSLLGLALITTSALWWAVRQRNQELVAHRAEMEVLNRFLNEDLIGSADPALVGKKGMSVLEAAMKSASVVDQKYGQAPPSARALIHADLQRTLLSLTQYKESIQEGQHALAALRESKEKSLTLELEIQIYLASAAVQEDRLDAAREALAQADVIRSSSELRETEAAIRYWLVRSNLLSREFKLQEALEAADMAHRIGTQVKDLAIRLRDQVDFNLGDVQKMAGKLDAATATFNSLHERQSKYYGVHHPVTCFTAVGQAMALSAQTEHVQEGLPIARDAFDCLTDTLGANDRHTRIALDVIATLYYRTDDFSEAAKAWNREVELLLPELGEQSVRIISTRSNIARCKMWQGKYAEAERLFREELDRVRQPRGEMDALVQSLRYETAHALLSQGRRGDAAALLDGIDPVVLGKVALADDWDVRLLFEQARLTLLSGDHPGATAKFEQVRQKLEDREEDPRIPADLLAELIRKARS